MTLTLLSFIAGMLTVLAPCTLPFLPVIIGGSVGDNNKFRPYIITGSLVVSLLLFTILLKISTLLINVDPAVWTFTSGLILIFLGVISLFPQIWDKISFKLGLSSSSNQLMNKFKKRNDTVGAMMTGLALGPVFSSCSPTYAFALATALQGDLANGIINILAYILGLAFIMLLICILGQRITKRLKWLSNPDGIFKKILAVIFILVGIAVVFGFDKAIQRAVDNSSIFSATQIDKNLLNKATNKNQNSNNFNNTNLIPANEAKQSPEFTGIENWINSEPVSISSLKGKVVLIDFWTYSCINCQRTQAYLNDWYSKYKDNNFEVIGIHAPEFSFEKKKENVEKAVREAMVKYPVGMDNNFKTFNEFGSQGWPYKILIDANGKIRYTHFGEGEYVKTEENIRALLAENSQKVNNTQNSNVQTNEATNSKISAETYLGWSRNEFFENTNEIKYNTEVNYTLVQNLAPNKWSLGGMWTINNELIQSQTDDSELEINFTGKKVYLVAGSDTQKNITVIATNQPEKTIAINDEKLYTLVDSDKLINNGSLKIKVPKGVRLNVFTFG